MEAYILEHYRKTGTFTYAGGYKDYFCSLPDDIAVLGRLICSQVIHRVTLKEGNTNANATLLYGDMIRYPWHRMRCEDDVLLTNTRLSGREAGQAERSGDAGVRSVGGMDDFTCAMGRKAVVL